MKRGAMEILCANMESLERRTLLSSVSSVVYADLNVVGAHSGAGIPLAIAVPPGDLTAVSNSPPTGMIKGRVFDDANRNGVMDHGEKQAVGASVMLEGPFPLVANLDLREEIFELHGPFEFNSLPAGQYKLTAVGDNISHEERTFAVDVEEGV